MSYKFEIKENNQFVITDTDIVDTTDAIKLDMPKSDAYYLVRELKNDNIFIYDKNSVNASSSGVIILALAGCVDETLTQFTKDSFRTWANGKLGFDDASGSGAFNVRDVMTTVACGNSITSQNRNTGTGTNRPIHLANAITDSCMQFKRIVATGFTDNYGIFGHGGATLETINSELLTDWFTPLDNADVTPDIILGDALIENDIIQGRTQEEIENSFNIWLTTVKTKWQGAIIHLKTPHPSFEYNTVSKQNNFIYFTNLFLSLDNGIDVFTTNNNSYLDINTGYSPLPNSIIASLNGTTLTVTNTTKDLEINSVINDDTYNFRITEFLTGTGGVGTYTVSINDTFTSRTLPYFYYTADKIHPNAIGSMMIARGVKPTLKRVSKVWKRNQPLTSSNVILTGINTAPVGSSGTISDGVVVSVNTSANLVFTANNPSMDIQYTTVDDSDQTGNIAFGDNFLNSEDEIAPFFKFEIISGAENLKWIDWKARVQDDNGFNFVIPTTGLKKVGTEMYINYKNGDVFTLLYSPIIPTLGSFVKMKNYILYSFRKTGGTVKLRILSQGYYKIS